MKKRLKHPVEPDKNCETGIEDVAWLCSLSESELVSLFTCSFTITFHDRFLCFRLSRLVALYNVSFVLVSVLVKTLIPEVMLRFSENARITFLSILLI